MGTLMSVCVSGIVLTGYMLWLGADSFQIGLLSSIPAIAGLLQLAAPYLVERAGTRKGVVLSTTYLTRILWLASALLPFYFFPVSPVWILIGIVSLATLCSSITNVSYLAWLGELVPINNRNGFFARRSQIAGLFSLIAAPLAGAYLDQWAHPSPIWGGRDDPRGFVIVITAGVLFGFISWLLLRAMPEPAMPKRPHKSVLHQLMEPLKDPAMRLYILHKCIFAFAIGIAAPFFTVYALKTLGLSFTILSGLTLLATGSNLAVLRIWGRLGERLGDWTVLWWGTAGKVLVPLLWIFTSNALDPMTYIVLILIQLTGVFDAGLGLGTSNLLLRLSPREQSTAYISVFTAVSRLLGAISPIIGGLLANQAGFQISLGVTTLLPFQILFLLSAILRFASLGPLWSLRHR